MSYADLVNPNIGRIGHLLTATRPTVMWPHAMSAIMPVYTPNVMDNYLTESIHGFPLQFGSFMPDARGDDGCAPCHSALYDRDFASMKCYRADIELEESGITVSYTASEHGAYYRVAFPAGSYATLTFKAISALPRHDIDLTEGFITADGSTVVTGMAGGSVEGFFYAQLSEAPISVHTQDSTTVLCFGRHDTVHVIELKAGISYIDMQQAEENLGRELSGMTFDEAVLATKAIWDKTLGAIEVTGGTEDQRITFYTAIWRMMNRMQSISEYGRYYSAYDGKVHEDTRDFYVNDGIWDTYRCAHPLQLLLQEGRQVDMVHSYLRMYEQSGWLPTFPFVAGTRNVMLGKHTTAMIVDTWRKGAKGFDIALAYEAMLKNADQATQMPWTGGYATAYDQCYFDNGFYPALAPGEVETLSDSDFERRQCVAVTLEVAYDDWCLAQIAKELGKEDDYQRLMQRSQNYRNVYNAETGFMSPKYADGSWVPDFDPKLSGGQGGRDYFAECNSWTYTWHVQHDIDGLAELMGGKEAMCARLDAMFREQYGLSKYYFLGKFPDSTGLIGQFCMGNEPSFHIPYLYNHGGQPWKTQRRVREIMDIWFGNSPLGICGDEDGGAMSAWYAFSAMGLYPTCPGKAEYDIGSPVFDEVKLHMENGKTFTLRAREQDARNKYIQSAVLDGKPYNMASLRHEDLAGGATLELVMGPKPNKAWGVG